MHVDGYDLIIFIRSPRFDALFGGHPGRRLRPLTKTPTEQKAALREYQEWLARHNKSSDRRNDNGSGPSTASAHEHNSTLRSEHRALQQVERNTEVTEEAAGKKALLQPEVQVEREAEPSMGLYPMLQPDMEIHCQRRTQRTPEEAERVGQKGGDGEENHQIHRRLMVSKEVAFSMSYLTRR